LFQGLCDAGSWREEMGFFAPKPKVIIEPLNKRNDFIGKFL
jgi:hypothetical protein